VQGRNRNTETVSHETDVNLKSDGTHMSEACETVSSRVRTLYDTTRVYNYVCETVSSRVRTLYTNETD